MANIEAQALVATCMDLRFQEEIHEWLKQNDLYGKHDRLAFAGAGTDIDLLIRQLRLSVKLHNTKEVYIFNHQSCGYYDPPLPSGTPEELERHKEDLEKAKNKIKEVFPQIKVNGLFMRLDKSIVQLV